MIDADGLRALRESVAWLPSPHVVELRLTGEHAFELLDRVFARELYVQDGQLRHGLLLDERGLAFADVYVGRDEDDFVLLAEGPTEAELLAYLQRHRPSVAEDVDVQPEGRTRFGIHGPYAWELLAEVFGPEVVGLPYLTFFREGPITCYRTGQTGEYGYLLSTSEPAALVARLVERGTAFDAREIELATLDRAAFESFFFCIRDPALAAIDPIRAQLQWRIGGSGFVGEEALPAAVNERLAMARVIGDPGDARDVTLEGDVVGRLVTLAATPSLGGSMATLLLSRPVSHPHIAAFRLGDAKLRTVTPPPIRPRSLFVNPQRHAYATREGQAFPPLVAPELE